MCVFERESVCVWPLCSECHDVFFKEKVKKINSACVTLTLHHRIDGNYSNSVLDRDRCEDTSGCSLSPNLCVVLFDCVDVVLNSVVLVLFQFLYWTHFICVFRMKKSVGV